MSLEMLVFLHKDKEYKVLKRKEKQFTVWKKRRERDWVMLYSLEKKTTSLIFKTVAEAVNYVIKKI